jgi:hypothetical protein
MQNYSPSECIKKLHAKGLSPLCEELKLMYHCDSIVVSPTYHKACYKEDVYFPVYVTSLCHNRRTNQWRYFRRASSSKNAVSCTTRILAGIPMVVIAAAPVSPTTP